MNEHNPYHYARAKAEHVVSYFENRTNSLVDAVVREKWNLTREIGAVVAADQAPMDDIRAYLRNIDFLQQNTN